MKPPATEPSAISAPEPPPLNTEKATQAPTFDNTTQDYPEGTRRYHILKENNTTEVDILPERPDLKENEPPEVDPPPDNQTVPWEAQVGWTYIGHGEWAQLEQVEQASHGNKLELEQDWIRAWLSKNDNDIRIHQEVMEKGCPNRWGAKIQVHSAWNLQLMADLLRNYEDREIAEWL